MLSLLSFCWLLFYSPPLASYWDVSVEECEGVAWPQGFREQQLWDMGVFPGTYSSCGASRNGRGTHSEYPSSQPKYSGNFYQFVISTGLSLEILHWLGGSCGSVSATVWVSAGQGAGWAACAESAPKSSGQETTLVCPLNFVAC